MRLHSVIRPLQAIRRDHPEFCPSLNKHNDFNSESVMVVRRLWYDSVRRAEADACSASSQLAANYDDPPVSVKNLSEWIGARLERYRFKTDRQGSLCRVEGNWVVRLAAEPSVLSPRERFVAAHELSHLMLLQRGVSRPVSEQEYWILEHACNRVARILLLPIQHGPSGALEPECIRSWFREMVLRWRLSGEDAARAICDRSANCVAVAFLEDNIAGTEVTWSYSRRRPSSWPVVGEYLNGEMSQFVGELVLSEGDAVCVRQTLDSELVGFKCLEPDSLTPKQTQLRLHEYSHRGDHPDASPVAFKLENAGQLELPLS